MNYLAFPVAGEYQVKVQYPLALVGSAEWPKHESNTITVRIKKPEGIDAQVWEIIQSRAFIYFLQWGVVHWQHDVHELVVPNTIELLKRVPESAYHPALKWALEKYYRHQTYTGKLDDKSANAIRSVLNIPEEKDPRTQSTLFLDDKRLDKQITYEFEKQTPYANVFDEISRKGGVPLKLAPEMERRSLASIRTTQPLRIFMDRADDYKAEWVPHGEGYLLRPAPEPPPPEPPPYAPCRMDRTEVKDTQ